MILRTLALVLTIALAQAQTPSIDPELKAHTAHFGKKVYKVADNVYSAVGYDLANTIMVVGIDGIVIVDTGSYVSTAKKVLAEFRKITPKPVRAIVLTHFHPDHISGAAVYASPEDVRAGRVDVYAHETLMANVQNQNGTIGAVLGVRSGYSFGAGLNAAETKDMNAGLGPAEAVEPGRSFLVPNKTFRDKLDVTIAGVAMRMMHVPSEAPDEIAIYLPANRVLLSAEVIQGPTFPNVHTLRGTSFRNPAVWFASIDKLRELQAEHMVPAHGQPLYGAARAEEVLRMYRDGIQFVHDQTIRFMNHGLTPDELANVVKLPPHLDSYAPYLRQYYGSVKHSVRQIYQGYLGWFDGDPVELDPIPRVDAARRRIALMGGRDKVLAESRRALQSMDAQWAAELATDLIRADNNDRDARLVKAAAFRTQGYAQMNTNWRNWYLVSANELDGTLQSADFTRRITASFASPDIIAAMPARVWVEGFSTRLKAESTWNVHQTAGFVFPDVKETYALELRRGIVQFHERADSTSLDLELTLDKATLNEVLLGKTKFPAAIAAGKVRITKGTPASVQQFFSYFEQPGESPIALTVR